MSIKLVVLVGALIAASPVFAASGPSSGGSTSATPSSGGGGHSGGGSGGGSGAFANRDARADHGHASPHSSAAHAAKPIAGQHVAFQHSTFKMSGTDHHHHHHHHPHNSRREPFFESPYVPDTCFRFDDPLEYPRNDCFAPTKRTPETHRRS
ncbi:MAG TPA: hypothetical protein VK652_01220 [Steroidobacteraceae bacterium]|nr:hypothetical protein [Steroidobacteraceae bacterium]